MGTAERLSRWSRRTFVAGLGLLGLASATGCLDASLSTPTSPETWPTPHPLPDAEVQRGLPPPGTEGPQSLERTIAARRSVRAYADIPLTDDDVSQLLWAAQGITDPAGLRAAPSAGALYPLELYVALPGGIEHYLAAQHAVRRTIAGDVRPALWHAALQQESVRQAPAVFVFTAVVARTLGRYGSVRTPRYVHMEVGHAAQNLLLQAVALGLAAVPIGAFDDAAVTEIMALPEGEAPLYLVPVGHRLGS